MIQGYTSHFKSYDELTISDDFLFGKIMRKEHICRMVLEILLGIEIDHLEYIETQKGSTPDYESHGIRMDVYVKDSGRIFNVEMQTQQKRDLVKRGRYYQALLDLDFLDRGNHYDSLPESYIIFICLHDPFARYCSDSFRTSLPVYTVESICKENGQNIADECHKIYYNCSEYSKVSDNQELQKVLKYIYDGTVDEHSNIVKELDTAVYESRRHEKWRREYMTWGEKIDEYKQLAREEGLAEGRETGLAEGRAEGRAEGLAEGKKETKLENARNLIKLEIPLDKIAAGVGLPLEQIVSLKAELDKKC